MIIDFVGFNKARLDNDRRMKRERRELAQAFNEFTRLNPMATAGQFQGFIDTMSGGSNYLRGGMPSGDALNAVIKSADQRRSIAEKERAQKDLTYSMDFMTKAGDMALGIMLNTKGTGENGTYSPTDLASMGKKFQERFPGVNFSELGINPVEIFNPRKKTEYIQDKLIELTPRITQMIQNSGGKIDMDLIEKTFSSLPTELWKPIQERALMLEGERKETYELEKRDKIIKEIETMKKGGMTNIYETLESNNRFDLSLLPPKGSDFWKQTEEQATFNLKKERENYATTKMGQMLEMTSSLKNRSAKEIYNFMMTTGGFDPKEFPPPEDPFWKNLQMMADQKYNDARYKLFVENRGQIVNAIKDIAKEPALNQDIRGTIVQMFGEDAIPPANDPIWQSAVKEATRLAEETDAAASREAQDILNAQRDTVLANESFALSLFLDDKENQLPKLRQFVESSLDQATIKRVFGNDGIPDEYFNNLINLISEGLEVKQRKDITETNRATSEAAGTKADAFVKANVEKVINWFGDHTKGKFNEQIVGKTGSAGQMAALMLANKYEMSQQAMYRMQQIMLDPNLPQGIDQVALMDLIENDEQFKASTTSLSKARQDVYENAQQTLGRFEQMSVTEYRDDVLQRIDTSLNDVKADINTITSRFADQYDNQIEALNDLMLALTKGQTAMMEELRLRESKSKDFSGWRTVGTEAWDDSMFFGDGDTVQAQLGSAISSLKEEIQSKINLAKEKKAAQAQLNPDPNVETNTGLSSEQSGLQTTIGNVAERGPKLFKLNQIEGKSTNDSGMLGYLMKSELEREQAKVINNFIKLPNVKEKLLDDPNSYNSFVGDPYEFIITSTEPWVINFWRTSEGKKLKESLGLNINIPDQ